MSRGYCPYLAFGYSGEYRMDLTEPCGIFWEHAGSEITQRDDGRCRDDGRRRDNGCQGNGRRPTNQRIPSLPDTCIMLAQYRA